MSKLFGGLILACNQLMAVFCAVALSARLWELRGDARLTACLLPGWAAVCALPVRAALLLWGMSEGAGRRPARLLQWTGTGTVSASA